MTNPIKGLPAVAHPGTAAAVIAVASSQLGYTEVGDNDTVFGKMYGLNHQPWCAMFLSVCAKLAGASKAVGWFAYTPAGADRFKRAGRWGSKPKVGAIAFYDTAGLGRISHVGIVDKVNSDGSWTSIEGNTNAAGSREGKVVRRQLRRSTGPRGGFGYPEYVKSEEKDEPAKPVNLAAVISKIKKIGVYDGRVAAALAKEGYPATKKGYAQWQIELGYEGADADGIAGQKSLSALGKKYGWDVA